MATEDFTRTDARRPERVAEAINELFDGAGGSTLVVADVTALRALDGDENHLGAILGGFTSELDGGEGSFIWTTDTTTPDDGGTIIAKSVSRVGAWKRIYSGALNVRWFGATGDGVTNDTTAVNTTINVAMDLGIPVHFPPGEYLVANVVFANLDGLTITGEKGSVIKHHPSNAYSLIFYSSKNIHVSNLTFDGNVNGATSPLGFFTCTGVSVVDCTFAPLSSTSGGIYTEKVSDVLIDRCRFLCNGINPAGTGVVVGGSCRNFLIRGCHFEAMTQGIAGSNPFVFGNKLTVENVNEDIVIDGCYFDGHWWSMSTLLSGGQPLTGGATFTDTTMTATSGPAFPSIEVGSRVRVLHKVSAATALLTNQTLTDSGGSFLSSGLIPGDLVRSGSLTGLVLGVVSDTVLQIEKWWETTTMTPATPAFGAQFAPVAYTAYKVYLGTVASNNTTVITLAESWFDLEGNVVGDEILNGFSASDVTYEIVPKMGYSGVTFDWGSRKIKVTNCTVLRTHSDSISLYGDENIVTHNHVLQGADTGLTINGQIGGFGYSRVQGVFPIEGGKSIIAHNRIDRLGIEGIFSVGNSARIIGNQITRSGWVTNAFTFTSDIVCAGTGVLIDGNTCDGMLAQGSRGGINGGNLAFSRITNNTIRRHQFENGSSADGPFGIALAEATAVTIPGGQFGPHIANIIADNLIGEEVTPIINSTLAAGWFDPGEARIAEYTAYNSAPALTVAGTPAANTFSPFIIEITTGGSETTAKFRWSSDWGYSWTSGVTADTSPIALGSTGITIAFAAGTYVAMSEDFTTGHFWRFYAVDGFDNSYVRNTGFVTEASGVATIANTTTSIVVTHGLGRALGPEMFKLTALENSTNDFGFLWVDTVTPTQFTINCKADPGASGLDVGWTYAEIPSDWNSWS